MARPRTYGILLDVDDAYGTRKLVARVVYQNDHGELLNPLDNGTRDDLALADLEVTAYVDRDNPHAWGFHHGYAPHHVELQRAEAMVRTLRKIAKGLDAATAEQGYVADFATYVLRVAATLRIRVFHVRNSDRRRAVTGRKFSTAQAIGVQSWIRDQEAVYAKSA